MKKQNKADAQNVLHKFYFQHAITHQKKYLTALALILLAGVFGSNLLNGKQLLIGAESYFHISQTQWNTPLTHLISLIQTYMPSIDLVVIPIFTTIAFIFLAYAFAARVELRKEFVFFFMLFLLLSPSVIFSFSTISAYAVFFVLLLSGFMLLFSKNKVSKISSVIPFLIASFFDIFSTIFLVFSLGIYYFRSKKDRRIVISILGTIILLAALLIIVFNQPFTLGPFYEQNWIEGIVSDIGAIQGIGFFTLLMSCIGLAVTWKKKKLYVAYAFVPLVILGIALNAQTILFLTVVLCIFAAIGFRKIFENKWQLENIKRITFFIVLLGILFSTLTYLDRISDVGPSKSDTHALEWIKENTAQDAVVFASLEDAYYVTHFANKQPFAAYGNHNEMKAKEALDATYISELFPIFEQGEVQVVYITKRMREKLPENGGLLFLLKNERFKMAYSNEEVEVWLFENGDTS